MGGFLGPQRASYLLFKAKTLLRLGGWTRPLRARLVPLYVLAISLLLVLACSRIPNPFSSVSALPIVRAARLAPTPTPLRYSQSLLATGTGQKSGQASANGGTELDENSILGPVNPVMVLAAVLELTQTAIAAESVESILGGLTRESHVKATTKIPFLGSLPLIGSLFGGESSSRRQTEIVFSIKVEEIVRFDGGGYGISSEDQAIIDQAEGSAPIEGPPST